MSTIIKQYQDKKQSLSEEQILNWFIQMALALNYIHH